MCFQRSLSLAEAGTGLSEVDELRAKVARLTEENLKLREYVVS